MKILHYPVYWSITLLNIYNNFLFMPYYLLILYSHYYIKYKHILHFSDHIGYSEVENGAAGTIFIEDKNNGSKSFTSLIVDNHGL